MLAYPSGPVVVGCGLPLSVSVKAVRDHDGTRTRRSKRPLPVTVSVEASVRGKSPVWVMVRPRESQRSVDGMKRLT